MTSTYLHVNCVVGVACAEAFANTNIAAGMDVDVASHSASEANCDTRVIVIFLITAMIAAKCSALWHRACSNYN